MIRERDAYGRIKATHGLSKEPLYNIFKAMHDRCENPKNDAYERYGGRGVFVCNEWSLDKIEDFISWAKKNGWEKGLELDRIDNSKGYSPENCRFVTSSQNSRNRRSNRYVDIFGERMLLCEAFEKYSVVTKAQFELRYYHSHWALERALTQPLQKRKSRKEMT